MKHFKLDNLFLESHIKKAPVMRKVTRRIVTRDKNEPITNTEKVMRNLPGSAWLYGGVKRRKSWLLYFKLIICI